MNQMNYAAAILAVTAVLVPVFVILAAYIVYQLYTTQELIMSFRTDADTATQEVLTAINAIPSRIPPAADPATIVPVADQTAVVDGIKSLKTAADSILPTPTT